MGTRVLTGLIGLTLILQLGILYKHNQSATSRPRPQPVREVTEETTVDAVGMPTLGDASARLVLIEFSDYECPFCARHTSSVAKQIQTDYVDSGRLRCLFANDPLPIHANARTLATAAICAGEQGAFWEAHSALFESPPITDGDVARMFASTDIEIETLRQCIESGPRDRDRIDRDMETARRLGLTGTPSFALGYESSPGSVKIEMLIVGAQPYEVFRRTIEDLAAQIGS